MDKLHFLAPSEELISACATEQLVRADFSLFCAPVYDTDQFVQMNWFGYYLVANTWLCWVQDLSTMATTLLLRKIILKQGLSATIRFCSKLADFFATSAHKAEYLDADGHVEVHFDDMLDEMTGTQCEFAYRMAKLPFQTSRQICVYPKRFAPIVPSAVSQLYNEAIEGFIDTDRSNQATERRLQALEARMFPNPRALVMESRAVRLARRVGISVDAVQQEATPCWVSHVVRIARAIIHEMVGDFESFDNEAFPRIGPGACRNAGRSMLERLERIVMYGQYRPSMIPQWHSHVGSCYAPHPDTREREYRIRKAERRFRSVKVKPRLGRGYWGKMQFITPQLCRVGAVPKKTDSDRIIAVEDVCNMSRQLQAKDLLEALIAKSGCGQMMPTKDQEENRRVARLACETNRLTTGDLSHASDSQTKALVRLLWPQSWWSNCFERTVPFAYITKEAQERVSRLLMFATMGCGLTFITMTITLFSLISATLIHVLNLEALNPHKTMLEICKSHFISGTSGDPTLLVRVMGDDCIWPSSCDSIIHQVLAYFGFSLNEKKSFSHGRFRESCGAEWLRTSNDVVDVSCCYYPRIPVGMSDPEALKSVYLEWKADQDKSEKGSLMTRILALQHRSFDKSPSCSKFLAGILQGFFPDWSTSFPNEADETIWSNEPDVSTVYMCPPDLECLPADAKAVAVEDFYVPEALAWYRFTNQVREEGKYPANSLAEIAAVQALMDASSRHKIIVPELCVVTHYTVPDLGLSEVLHFEQMLRHLTTEADRITCLNILPSVRAVAERSGRFLPSDSVRPLKFSMSQLTAEEYSVHFTARFI